MLKSNKGIPFRLDCRGRRRPRRGAMVLLVLLMLVVVIVMVTFSVDVAYMQLTRTELRTSTDAAARASGEALSRLQDKTEARAAAKAVAKLNKVGGKPLKLRNSDIVFGHSTPAASGPWAFTAGAKPINATRVTGRRTVESKSGPIPLFFGGLLGRGTFEPVQTATSVRLDRDVCLVVDRSGSMAWDLSGTEWSYPAGASECEKPHAMLSRWGALTSAVTVFLDAVATTPTSEKIGLVSYASDGTWCGRSIKAVTTEQPLTKKSAKITDAMNTIGDNLIHGRTNIAAGIDAGTAVLTDPDRSRPFAEKTMIVLTDGIYNEGRDPADAARDAAKQDMVIHTITFSSGANQSKMQEVATIGKGRHYHAPDAKALEAAFYQIALTLPVVLTD